MPREASGQVTKIMKKGKPVWVARWKVAPKRTGQKQCKTQAEARRIASEMTALYQKSIDQQGREGPESLHTPRMTEVGESVALNPRVAALRGRLGAASFEEVVEKYEAAKKRGYNGSPPLKENALNGYRKHHRYWIRVFAAAAKDRIGWIEAARTVRDELLDITSEKDAPFGRKTAKAKFTQLQRVCRFALAEGIIGEDPTAGQDIRLATTEEKIRSRAIKREAAYRPDEVKAMLAAADALTTEAKDIRSRRSWLNVYRPFLHVLVATGCRFSEARALTRANIDTAKNRIHIEAAADHRNAVDTPKSANAVRSVPVPSKVMDMVVLALSKHNHALVFATSEGRVRADNTYYDFMLTPLAKKAEVPNRGMHGFRHHYASRHIAAGTPPLKLSQLLGHHSPSFTMDVYAHFFEELDDAPVLDLTS